MNVNLEMDCGLQSNVSVSSQLPINCDDNEQILLMEHTNGSDSICGSLLVSTATETDPDDTDHNGALHTIVDDMHNSSDDEHAPHLVCVATSTDDLNLLIDLDDVDVKDDDDDDGDIEDGRWQTETKTKQQPKETQYTLVCQSSDGDSNVMVQSTESSTGQVLFLQVPGRPLISGIQVPQQLVQVVADGGDEGKQDMGVNQSWFTSKEQKETLTSKGQCWKQGMWSHEEVQILTNNINKYCRENGISDPRKVIFHMNKDGRKDFYRIIAAGINRPLFSVYRRVIRMYDNRNYIGKYSDEEVSQLKRLHQKHGNNWQAIAHAMGRSPSSIKDRCRLLRDNCNQGKWLSQEEERLAKAVYELTNAIPGEQVTTGISWAAVADKVATRSEKQCRTKWLNYLNWKTAGGREWTRDDDLNLITRLLELDSIEDENQIDWELLARENQAARSPQWLRGKWWNLKRAYHQYPSSRFQDVCLNVATAIEAQQNSGPYSILKRTGKSDKENTPLRANVQLLTNSVIPINTGSVDSILQNSATMLTANNVVISPVITPRVDDQVILQTLPLKTTMDTVCFGGDNSVMMDAGGSGDVMLSDARHSYLQPSVVLKIEDSQDGLEAPDTSRDEGMGDEPTSPEGDSLTLKSSHDDPLGVDSGTDTEFDCQVTSNNAQLILTDNYLSHASSPLPLAEETEKPS